MSNTTINAFVFRRQNDNLQALSEAIGDIGCRVQLITRNLPASFKGQVDELLDREMTAIASTCHCLGEVALAASNEAERWQSWAEGTNTCIKYDPHKPVAMQVPVAGATAEDQSLQGILEQTRSVWIELDGEGRLDLCADVREVLAGAATTRREHDATPVEVVPPKWKFGSHRLKTAREARGVRLKELAALVGTAPQQLREWESGEGSPGQEILAKICTALDCPPKFFFVQGA
jgi:DNA-binding Xre family transcriptional regulator